MTGPLLPLLLAASVLLPAAPRAVAVGDLDGDGSPEIVVLLAWPRWGTELRDVSSGPGVAEYEVSPAVEERREIRAFRLAGDRLVPAARPLPVGGDVLALGAGGREQPVLVLVDAGLARLRVQPPGREGSLPSLALAEVARVPHLLAGTREVFTKFPLAFDLDGAPPAEAIVPRVDGISLLHPDGARLDLPLPVVHVHGTAAEIALPMPTGGGPGGAPGLLAWLPRGARKDDRRHDLGRVAFYRRRGPFRWDPPRTWDLSPLADALLRQARPAGPDGVIELSLAGVADWDRDGTLEAALEHRAYDLGSVMKVLRTVRAAPARFTFHGLRADGTVEREPRWTVETTGMDYPFVEDGPQRPFADLDGDGLPELVTVDLGITMIGVGRAVVTGTGKAIVRPHVLRFSGRDGWREVPRAVPDLVGKVDLRGGGFRRFARWPADLDGDGLRELVEVAEDQVRIRYGRPGPRWPDRPDLRLDLAGPLRHWLGLHVIDLDGRPPRELLLLEDVPRQARNHDHEERLAEPVLLEVVRLPGRKGETR